MEIEKSCTLAQLRKKYGITRGSLLRLIINNHVKCEKGFILEKTEEEVIELLKEHTNSVIPEKLPVPDDFMSLHEASELKNVHPETIRRWAKGKKIKIYKVFSETNEFVRKSEIDKIKKGEWNEQDEKK